MVAQALRQADTDVAIEAWADRSAAPRDLAQLMAEVRPPAALRLPGLPYCAESHLPCPISRQLEKHHQGRQCA